MGVPNVAYEWNSLRRLYVCAFAMNVTGCGIAITMFVFGVKLRTEFGDYLNMIAPGDGGFWPGIVILAAIFCAPIYIFGTKVCLSLRKRRPDSNERLNRAMFAHCVSCLISLVLVFGINVAGAVRLTNFEKNIYTGILDAMRVYAEDLTSKTRLDEMQMRFECCGSKSFRDWFYVHWLSPGSGGDTEYKDQNGSSFVSADVPFSCCLTNIVEPCDHRDIFGPNEVFLYEPERTLTISTTGCHEKILARARYVNGLSITALVAIVVYQMILALLSRLLQTAHSNAFYIGPKKVRYLAWIFGWMPNPESYDRLVYRSESIPVEEILLLRGHSDSSSSMPENISSVEEPKRSVNESRCGSYSNAKSTPSDVAASSTRGTREQRTGIARAIPTPPPSPSLVSDGIGNLAEFPARRTGQSRLTTTSKLQKSCCKKDEMSRREVKPVRNETRVSRRPDQPSWNCDISSLDRVELAVLDPESSSNHLLRRRDAPTSDSQRVEIGSGSSSSSRSNDSVRCFDRATVEDDENRVRRFCKDLSTEYKRSLHSKWRRNFSEMSEPRVRYAADNREIRNEVRAKFNQTDTYSRFRGSEQDTAMRRMSRARTVPPPLPIFDQKPKRREELKDDASCCVRLYQNRGVQPPLYRQTGSIGATQRIQPRHEISWAQIYPPTTSVDGTTPVEYAPLHPRRLSECCDSGTVSNSQNGVGRARRQRLNPPVRISSRRPKCSRF